MASCAMRTILLFLLVASETTGSELSKLIWESSKLTKTACCPDLWTRVGDYCYMTSPEPMSWFHAQQYCIRVGGYLIEIRDKKVQASLEQFLLTDIFYWIGLTDLPKEGTFVWQSDFEEANHTFWMKGQPDNGRNNEDCVHLVSYMTHFSLIQSKKNDFYQWDNFQWNDRNCEEKAVEASQIGSLGNIHALCETDISYN